jgi:hypothetical protein
MEAIIDPIDRNLLKKELTKDKLVRTTRKGDNEIYILNYHNAPNTVKEIGRLREVSFRSAGGGTKLSIDLDHYDTDEICYDQLIVWSPEDEEIIGGYRFIHCSKILPKYEETNKVLLSTAHYFELTENFIQNYFPRTIELGRSWVQPNYQPSKNPRKGLFALDNLWDGLAVLTVVYPELKCFFGKVTMYPNYDRECRDFLLYFMRYYFKDEEKLATPIHPLIAEYPDEQFEPLIKGLDFKEGFKVLNQFIRSKEHIVPPLINIYMHLSPTMKTFGTALNKEFGGVEETAILVKIEDIYEDKKERHIKPLLEGRE